MCEESAHVACTLKNLIECIPENVDTYPLQHLYKNAFYTAPEACNDLWISLYNVLRNNYDTGKPFQHKMCVVYNEGYTKYVERFVK